MLKSRRKLRKELGILKLTRWSVLFFYILYNNIFMKNVLCFGDSNTFGFNPQTGGRYNKNERWCGVLQNFLGNNFNIIEEGCNARTINFLDFENFKICGKNYLSDCLEKYENIDLIIILLGLNDFQISYNSSVEEVLDGLKVLCDIVKNSKFKNSKLLFLAPLNIRESILCSHFGCLFDLSAVKKSQELSSRMKDFVTNIGCEFFNLNEIGQTSDIDGLHMDIETHKKIGETLSGLIPQLI